jgi:hypothetical protein
METGGAGEPSLGHAAGDDELADAINHIVRHNESFHHIKM